MKTDLQTIQDLFKISYEAYETSRVEEKLTRDLWNGRHYTESQLAVLAEREQPAEQFNIVRLFTNVLLGHWKGIVNTVKIEPRHKGDEIVAKLLHDTVQHTLKYNNFSSKGDRIKLDAILCGLMVLFEDVVDLPGEFDEHGRPLRRIELTHVPAREILLDPMSTSETYEDDAEYIHRFKWVSESTVQRILEENNSKKKSKDIMDNLEAYDNHVNQEDAEFTLYHQDRFIGLYKQYDAYLLIHSVIKGDDGKRWSVMWIGDEEIARKEITYAEVTFPYRVQKVGDFDSSEYYGMFHGLINTQYAINESLIKIQLMANTRLVFVQQDAVEDLDQVEEEINKVGAVIPVLDINGIDVRSHSAEVREQYELIEKGLKRVQSVLGINNSVLGAAFASSSAKKVRLEQGATTKALGTTTTKLEEFYRLVGMDICNLIKQYYTANEVLKIADTDIGFSWAEINAPFERYTGRNDINGAPIMETPFEEVRDPESNEVVKDENGNIIVAPQATLASDLSLVKFDIDIDPAAYDDNAELDLQMLQTVVSGAPGNTLLQLKPQSYLKVIGKAIRATKTSSSGVIATIFEELGLEIEAKEKEMMAQQEQQPTLTEEQMVIAEQIMAQQGEVLGQSPLPQAEGVKQQNQAGSFKGLGG